MHQAGCACRRGGSRNVPFATKRVPYSKPVRRAANSVKRYTDWVRSPSAIQLQARLTIAAPNKHHGSSAKYGRVHELECGTAQRKVVPSARNAAPFLVPKDGTLGCSLLNKNIIRGPENGTKFGAENRHRIRGRVYWRQCDLGSKRGPFFDPRKNTRFRTKFRPYVTQIRCGISTISIFRIETSRGFSATSHEVRNAQRYINPLPPWFLRLDASPC